MALGDLRGVAHQRWLRRRRRPRGRETEKHYQPLQPGDVPKIRSDIINLARDTGYRTQVSVEEGVRRFVESYRWYYGV